MKKRRYLLILFISIIILSINVSSACSSPLETSNLTSNNISYLEINKPEISVTDIDSANDTNETVIIVDSDSLKNYTTIPITEKTIIEQVRTEIKTINQSGFYKSKYLEIYLVDFYGNKVPNQTIYMTLNNGKTSKTYKLATNNKGNLKVQISLNQTYTAQFEFKGKGKYLASKSSKITVIKDLDLESIKNASITIQKYIEKNGALPKSVLIKNINFTMSESLYLLTKAVININKNNKSNILLKNVENPSNPITKQLSGKIYKREYINLANEVLKYFNTNSKAPNYISCSLGKISYNQAIHIFSKIITFYKTENRLANYVELEDINSFKKSSPTTNVNTNRNININSNISSLNDIYTGESLTKYLSASLNCQSTNSQIVKLAKTLTSKAKDTYAKAVAIFNYVRDNIEYKKYNNTKKGATGTLSSKSGNCVDQSHLVIALARAAGIPARYVHGTNCKFTSGLVSGHVWAQILVGNTWFVADPTSYRNSLGTVKNWDTNNYNLKSKTSSINF